MTDIQKPRVLPLWIFPMDSPLKEISISEEKIANSLHPRRAKEYKHARSYVRFALSQFFKLNPLEIPLKASIGKAPLLGNNLGHVSFSHCNDALLIGWSPTKLGVDIERSDRALSAEGISERFFHKYDQNNLKSLNNEDFRKKVLEQWVIKEAAIKWQRGTLSKDLKNWHIKNKSNVAIHQTLNHEVKIQTTIYRSWIIAIASNDNQGKGDLMICAN
ncbi:MULTISPECIES: 4'-phosphopantetheinyl transferase family protein [Prochlorococcus]|uniref:4'-phosphopantetheinyl transferase family protein n=1 Tax=Prochlorococcus TaxID=1218 RepID=UPI0005338182|nr:MULTISPECIES: 4'-phosphopantetheinyl transferase superfamily protein [Prochlorococcus]KGG32602.1 putative 4'-phosphopantetheinyl transferase family protein [Prochlorococcus marinus str. SS51]